MNSRSQRYERCGDDRAPLLRNGHHPSPCSNPMAVGANKVAFRNLGVELRPAPERGKPGRVIELHLAGAVVEIHHVVRIRHAAVFAWARLILFEICLELLALGSGPFKVWTLISVIVPSPRLSRSRIVWIRVCHCTDARTRTSTDAGLEAAALPIELRRLRSPQGRLCRSDSAVTWRSSGSEDSNLELPAPKAGALPIELPPDEAPSLTIHRRQG